MAEDVLQELIKEAGRLTLDQQLQLIKQLEQIVRLHNQAESSHRLWREIQHQREQILSLATKQGASNVRVFDVGVRHDTSPAGEVNFLVNLEPGKSLLALAGLMVDLQELLDCDVYVTESPELREQKSDLPWAEMVAMRNILVHRYYELNLEIVWLVVEQDLPDIKGKIEAILQELGEE